MIRILHKEGLTTTLLYLVNRIKQKRRLRQMSDDDLMYSALLWKSKLCIPELRRRKLPIPLYVLES
jgi:hypothetical protein